MYNNAPSPEILLKIANASNGITTYEELMLICGYLSAEQFQSQLMDKYNLTNSDFDYIKPQTLVLDFLTPAELDIVEDFLLEYSKCKDKPHFNADHFLNGNLTSKQKHNIKKAIDFLIEELNNSAMRLQSTYELKKMQSQYYMCPVYGRISAGQPNWAEECIEGRLPIDPELMNILNPEECYFLRVNGESMNKVVKNGAYALIRKMDWVENGEIAVVLVNGYDATLKKFTQNGDVVVLEPMSDDPSFKTQIYTKDTSIKVIGKYIGKMEMK